MQINFKTEEGAVETMRGLKENPLFRNSFAFVLYGHEMPRLITVTIENFSTIKSAKKFSQLIRERTGLNSTVDSDKNEITFRVSAQIASKTKGQVHFWINSIHSAWDYPGTDLAIIP